MCIASSSDNWEKKNDRNDGSSLFMLIEVRRCIIINTSNCVVPIRISLHASSTQILLLILLKNFTLLEVGSSETRATRELLVAFRPNVRFFWIALGISLENRMPTLLLFFHACKFKLGVFQFFFHVTQQIYHVLGLIPPLLLTCDGLLPPRKKNVFCLLTQGSRDRNGASVHWW